MEIEIREGETREIDGLKIKFERVEFETIPEEVETDSRGIVVHLTVSTGGKTEKIILTDISESECGGYTIKFREKRNKYFFTVSHGK